MLFALLEDYFQNGEINDKKIPGSGATGFKLNPSVVNRKSFLTF